MFKYVYEVAPIDFTEGTISIENYIDSIISDLSWYKGDLLHDVNVDEDAEDDIGVNLCMSPFEEEHMGSEHVFYRLKKIGRDVENICKYFNKKKLKINKKYIRIFSVPTETECTISYMIKTNDHGITYIFSDLYFPFLNRRENNIEKFD